MSYNIDNWKTKELVDLQIPVASLFKNSRRDWHPQRTNNDDGSVEYRIMETNVIKGTINDDILFVSSIVCIGEGSGTAMNLILEPALSDSTGRLVASCVWEGGDSINRLTVDDGLVTWEEIEI